MGENVLVPYDGSPLSQRALERALTKHPDDQITVLYVIDPMLAVYEAEAKGLPAARTWTDRMEERADDVFADARKRASEHGCEITTTTESGQPTHTILEFVKTHGIDHVIMGSHGREGVSRLILGSVAEGVMRRAPIPVTIVR